MKLDILAIGVHPDDIELGCSGTLLKSIHEGKTVGILDLSQGELGTRGNATLRLQEAHLSAQKMGAAVRENLAMKDGFFEYNENHLKAIIAQLRRFQPEIVLANTLQDRHPDHARAAKLVADACFYAGLRRIETHDPITKKIQLAWRPKAVFHYIQDQHLTPHFVIDISNWMEQKIEQVLCFQSQFHNPTYTAEEPQTPISGRDFIELLYAKARVFGRDIGVPFAEGFQTNRTIGVRSLFDLL